MNLTYVFLAIILMSMLFAASLSASMAIRRGLDARRWYILGFFTGVLAVIVLLRFRRIDSVPKSVNQLLRNVTPSVRQHCHQQSSMQVQDCLNGVVK